MAFAPLLPGQDAETRPGSCRWAKTDDNGWYRFRVVAGDYRLAGPDNDFIDLKVNNEETITRDFKWLHQPRGPF